MDEYIALNLPRGLSEIDGNDLWHRYNENPAAIQDFTDRISERRYLYWDKAKYVEPAEGFSILESWWLAHFVRTLSSRSIPVRTPDGKNFTWVRQEGVDEMLRKIDMYAGGQFLTNSDVFTSESERQKYVTRGIMEEAIASSQLEGADTSRRYAKQMIAENIKPRNKSDWMILNNHVVLSRIDEDYRTRSLSREMLLELHAELTKNTLDSEDEEGRFRTDQDDIVVHFDNKIAHIPPKPDVLEREIDRLIKYANDVEKFVHPVIKAIVLHFWLGYLHPFTDGNGRMARAIFYWYMLKNDYWAFGYLPISTVIKKAPRQYAYAYIYAEQDNLDFTYFFDYHIRRIIMAIEDFANYTVKTEQENNAVSRKLQHRFSLNNRQKQMVLYLIAGEAHYVTISSHYKLNGISRITADRDIKEMLSFGLLNRIKQGNTVQYFASHQLHQIIDQEG